MNTLRLSKRTIDALMPPTGKQPAIYWDESLPDFGVLIHPNGRKYYIMRYLENGKQTRKTIGPCELTNFARVKESAKDFLSSLIALPAPVPTPSSPSSTNEPAPYSQINFAEFCIRYMERHAKLHKESWKLDETRIRKYLLPAFASKNLSEISRGMVATLHQEIGMQYPYQANRVREQLSTMIEIAKVWELLPENHPNPTRGIKDFEELHRNRWLKKSEVERMISALQQEPCLYIRVLFVLYLLTGARKCELMKIRWKEVDLENGYIKILKPKNKQIHELPLSSAALLLLKQLPRLPDNDYVFPGKIKGNPYVNVDKPWKRVREKADLLDVRIHDIRSYSEFRIMPSNNEDSRAMH